MENYVATKTEAMIACYNKMKSHHRNDFIVHPLIDLSTAFSETSIKTNVLSVPSRPLFAFRYKLMTACHEPH